MVLSAWFTGTHQRVLPQHKLVFVYVYIYNPVNGSELAVASPQELTSTLLFRMFLASASLSKSRPISARALRAASLERNI